jgi:hypothetical protein
MKIKALSTFVAFTGQMNVFNAGDTGDLPDAVASQFIDAGRAVAVDADPLDHDGDGESGGSVSATGPDISGLRAIYQEVLGKKPFPGWDADELQRRIDAHEAAGDQAPAA